MHNLIAQMKIWVNSNVYNRFIHVRYSFQQMKQPSRCIKYFEPKKRITTILAHSRQIWKQTPVPAYSLYLCWHFSVELRCFLIQTFFLLRHNINYLQFYSNMPLFTYLHNHMIYFEITVGCYDSVHKFWPKTVKHLIPENGT